jgi:hypothetical protein
MRNRVAHPTHNDRSWDWETWFQAWWLAQTYLELAILHKLAYEGQYFDRSESKYKPVPWVPAQRRRSLPAKASAGDRVTAGP